jgi:hypothetical protein
MSLHRGRANYGQAQLGSPGLQKGEHFDHVLALLFGILPPLVDVGCPVGQLLEAHIDCVLGLTCIFELALQNSDPLSELSGLTTSRGQRGGVVCLHIQQPISGLLLS